MSNIVFALIEEAGVPTHFVKQLSDRDTLEKAVTIFPLEVIIRNVAAGSFSQRYGIEEGSPLLKTTLEFSLKNDDLGDPLINDDHVIAIGLATEKELATVKKYTHKVNKVMSDFFLDKGLKLIDFKIEFGKLADGTIVLADEVSPDTCRLWDVETGEKMDKDRFRRDLGNVEETYKAVLSRIKEKQDEEYAMAAAMTTVV
jgi:phosphoribosylaminoimidazole-succinocarboxamide synthase